MLGSLAVRVAGRCLPGCLPKPLDHPTNVVEQLTTLFPNGVGISLQLVHPRLPVRLQSFHLPLCLLKSLVRLCPRMGEDLFRLSPRLDKDLVRLSASIGDEL